MNASASKELKKKSTVKALPRGSACTICRKRKLRCDGVRPSCSTCVRLKHACGYGDPGHEKLAEQIQELESNQNALLSKIGSLESELEDYKRGKGMISATVISPESLDSPHLNSFYSSHSASPPVQLEQKPIPTMSYSGYDLPPVLMRPPPLLSEASLNSMNDYNNTPYIYETYSTENIYDRPDELPQAALNPSPPRPEVIYDRPPSPQTQVRRPHSSLQQLQAHLQHRIYHDDGEFGDEQEDHSTYNSADEFELPERDKYQNLPGPHLQSFPFSISNSSTGLAGLLSNARSDGRPVHPLPRYGSYSNGNNNFQRVEATLESTLPSPPIGRNEYPFPPGELISSFSGALPESNLLKELTTLYFVTVSIHLPFLNRNRFLLSLNHPTSLSSAPSLALIYAILAISALYHSNPNIRIKAPIWYQRSREYIEIAIQNGIKPKPLKSNAGAIISLTVEVVQALVLLTMIEMSRGDHQRCFMSISQASRIAAMLGLHRMDEDRIVAREGIVAGRRLRPPSLHALPEDPQLLEECRRSMCAVIVIDRFEAACVGWPSSIKEGDLRLLLPCHDELYEQSICNSNDCPLWWPDSIATEEQFGPKVSSFAWLCRIAWLGSRIQSETYRASGNPMSGPFNDSNCSESPLDDVEQVMAMDLCLDTARTRLNFLATSNPNTSLDLPIVMSLIVLNCLIINLHHLRVVQGLTSLPFNSSNAIQIGSAEFSMQRCLEGLHSVYEIVAQLVAFDKLHTSVYPRINSFTTFPPYLLFCLAFPAKFALGDWKLMGTCWAKVESNNDQKVEKVTTQVENVFDESPSGEQVFGPGLDADRLALIEMFVTGMDRMSVVWESVSGKFITMINESKRPLFDRVHPSVTSL